MKDEPVFTFDEEMILEKFEGDALPENLVERVYLKNGRITKREKIIGGKVAEILDVLDEKLDNRFDRKPDWPGRPGVPGSPKRGGD